jgi:hypothetical protein
MRAGGTLLGLVLGTASGAAPDAGTASAPLKLRRAMPFVQVMVNGRGPFTFGIDTGTGTEALVAPAHADALSLPSAGTVEAGDPSGKNPRHLRQVKVATLSVAGVDFTGITAAVYAPSQAEGRCDGILGFPLFRGRLLTIDYPGSRLLLGTGSLSPPADGTTVPFRAPDGVPVVDLRVGSETVPAVVDSRGSGLALPASLAPRLKLAGEPMVIGRGRTISGEFEVRGVDLAEDVRLGPYTFQRPFVGLHPEFPIGNVGGIVLRAFVVTFDQRARLLRLEAPERTLVLPRPRPRAAPDAGAQEPGRRDGPRG